MNLGTMLCAIADVYDAMRSQRSYQQAFPTDRILAVLKRNDGTQLDQHLVRRFVQLLGIYPPGNLVRLSTGEIAVVPQVHAPDPYRPRVRVLFAADGTRLDLPFERNLWERARDGGEADTRRSAGRSRRLRHRSAELPDSLMSVSDADPLPASSVQLPGPDPRIPHPGSRNSRVPSHRDPRPVYSLR